MGTSRISTSRVEIELSKLAVTRTYLTFGDIEGKLEMLRVECTKCPRKGRYNVARLIEKYGQRANMMKMEGTAQRRLSEA
jgi:hypothetical protein